MTTAEMRADGVTLYATMTYGEAALTVTLTVLGTLGLTGVLLLRRDITE